MGLDFSDFDLNVVQSGRAAGDQGNMQNRAIQALFDAVGQGQGRLDSLDPTIQDLVKVAVQDRMGDLFGAAQGGSAPAAGPAPQSTPAQAGVLDASQPAATSQQAQLLQSANDRELQEFLFQDLEIPQGLIPDAIPLQSSQIATSGKSGDILSFMKGGNRADMLTRILQQARA